MPRPRKTVRRKTVSRKRVVRRRKTVSRVSSKRRVLRKRVVSKRPSQRKRVVGKTRTKTRRASYFDRVRTELAKPGNRQAADAGFGLAAAGASSMFGPLGGLAVGAAKIGYDAIFGHGDYKIQQNSIAHGSQIPSFDSSGKHCVRVKHREYVQDILSTTTFSNTSFILNPANAALFPWLSSIACQFEEYRIEGMVMEFRSMSGNAVGNSSSQALGSVIMATEYNAALAPYTSKIQMENSEFSSSCLPSDNMLHAIECKRSETALGELYVNTGSIPLGDDPRFYNFGTFQIATTNCPAVGYVLGELWVSYDVSFYKEKVGFVNTEDVSIHYTCTGASQATSAQPFFNTSAILQPGSTHTPTILNNTITLPVNFPVGSYVLEIDYIWGGAGGSATVPTLSVSGGASTMAIFQDLYAQIPGGGQTCSFSANTGTSYGYSVNFGFTIPFGNTAAPVIITASTGGFSATQYGGDITITPLNSLVKT